MNEIEKNERLVAAIAKQYENNGLTHEELIEAGTQGFYEAERYYQSNLKFRFPAYAVWWIRHHILLAIEEKKNRTRE